MTYEPQEDSFLLLKHIKNNITSKDKVLDMGTGSGILAREVSKFSKQVTAIDIDNKIINKLMAKQDTHKISYLHSDLFSNIKSNDRFNVILFNPPIFQAEESNTLTWTAARTALRLWKDS